MRWPARQIAARVPIAIAGAVPGGLDFHAWEHPAKSEFTVKGQNNITFILER